jgi:HK97 family phage major capsid protein
MTTEKTEDRTQGRQPPRLLLSERDLEGYSISRAILAAVEIGERGNDAQRDTLELEVSRELSRSLPPGVKNRGGLFIPTTLHRSGLDSETSTKGRELVFTEFGGFIGALRRRARVLSLGAILLSGLRSNVGFPRQTSTGLATWVGENPGSDVGETDMALDLVTLTPKTLMSNTRFSRQLLEQSTPGVDRIVSEDLASDSALALDLAALHGTGSADDPTGIYSRGDVSAVAFGGQVTHAKVVEMETAVSAADGDIDTETLAYLATPEVRATAKKTAKGADITQSLWEDDRMNDHRAEVTNQLSKTLGDGEDEHALVYGDWSQMVIGEWGLELIVDPYTLRKRGMIEVTSFLMADVTLRHGESFRKATGLLP